MEEERDLQLLYQWVDDLPLSRPKRNISRDFADGVLVAEILKHFFPRLVELHNYSAAHSVDQKLYNWRTLNTRVFAKLSFELSATDMHDLVHAVPGAIERFLFALQDRIAVIQQRRQPSADQTAGSSVSDRSAEESTRQRRSGPGPRSLGSAFSSFPGSGHLPPSTETKGQSRGSHAEAVPYDIVVEKNHTIDQLNETIRILNEKIHRLEDIVIVKDNKILALQEALAGQQGLSQAVSRKTRTITK